MNAPSKTVKRQRIKAPSKTVKTGSAAGALSIIVIWGVKSIWPDLDVPPEVSAAFTLLLSSAAAWIVRDPNKGVKHEVVTGGGK